MPGKCLKDCLDSEKSLLRDASQMPMYYLISSHHSVTVRWLGSWLFKEMKSGDMKALWAWSLICDACFIFVGHHFIFQLLSDESACMDSSWEEDSVGIIVLISQLDHRYITLEEGWGQLTLIYWYFTCRFLSNGFLENSMGREKEPHWIQPKTCGLVFCSLSC